MAKLGNFYINSALGKFTVLVLGETNNMEVGMAVKESKLEVFQELSLHHPAGLEAARSAVLAHLGHGWVHSPQREDNQDRRDVDMIALERLETSKSPGVALWMSAREDSRYWVSNVVPLKNGELGISGYNMALRDFANNVLKRACRETELSFELSKADKTIEDWAGEHCAAILRSFSNLANKSTGRSHPLDGKRWFLFLLAAHRENSELESDKLARWLIEAEGWPQETAYDLASEYDLSRTLLKLHDKSR